MTNGNFNQFSAAATTLRSCTRTFPMFEQLSNVLVPKVLEGTLNFLTRTLVCLAEIVMRNLSK